MARLLPQNVLGALKKFLWGKLNSELLGITLCLEMAGRDSSPVASERLGRSKAIFFKKNALERPRRSEATDEPWRPAPPPPRPL